MGSVIACTLLTFQRHSDRKLLHHPWALVSRFLWTSHPLISLPTSTTPPTLRPTQWHCHTSIWGCFGGFAGIPLTESTCSLFFNSNQAGESTKNYTFWHRPSQTAGQPDKWRVHGKCPVPAGTRNKAVPSTILLQDVTMNGQKVGVEAKKKTTKKSPKDTIKYQASASHQ